MSSKSKKIIEEILELPREERERIADEVWRSLDGGEDGDSEAAWDVEIKKRLDEIDSGKVEMIPWEKVQEEIEEKLRAKRKVSSGSET